MCRWQMWVFITRVPRLSYREASEEGTRFGLEIKGLITVLMENHIQYDFILDDQISKEKLEKYRLVILPNIRCMSEKEIELLGIFVHNGGNLLATYATSLYNAEGKELEDFGLSELFGVHYTGKKLNTREDNYQYIFNPKHPLVEEDSKNTELLFNSGYTLLCKPVMGTEVICTLTPIIHNQPPDKSWVEKLSTEFPTIVENNYGKGKVIYFSNQPDTLTYTIGHPDVRNLLFRSVKYLLGSSGFLQTNAPESVHIGLTESMINRGLYILSLVNTTSGPIRPIRSLIPVHDINIKLRLEGKSLDNYKVLRAQGDTIIKAIGQEIILDVKKLVDFCAISIQMEV
jgi:hypothetical protein